MEIIKLNRATLTSAQFSQMIELEKDCGLEPYSPDMLMECITQMNTIACMDGQQLAGFITVHPSTRYLGGGIYIVNLNVAQDYRRQGIAKTLMFCACGCYASSHAQQRVLLDVGKDNAAAMCLYKSLGFIITDEPSGNGDTDVVMAVSLGELLRMTELSNLDIRIMTQMDAQSGIDILMNDTVKQTYMLPDLTEESAKSLYDRLCKLSQSDEHYIRGIYQNRKLIGFINDTQITHGQIELGWVVHPDYHNRGYATQAVRAAIEQLFRDGFDEVTAGAFVENPASIRVMQKCGMQLLEKVEEIEYRGKTHFCVFYAIKKG